MPPHRSLIKFNIFAFCQCNFCDYNIYDIYYQIERLKIIEIKSSHSFTTIRQIDPPYQGKSFVATFKDIVAMIIHKYLQLIEQQIMDNNTIRISMIAEHIKNQPTQNQQSILFQESNSIIKVTLNRPKALNSMNLQMVQLFTSKLKLIEQNKAFWIEGAGGKSFCAGGDVKVLFEKGFLAQQRLKFFREEFTLDYKLSVSKSLQISIWDGVVMGGGVGLSAYAPFVVATENTIFAMPQAKLGFVVDVGVSYLFARLRKNIGYYLGMTGARLKGQDVYIAGLANYYIPRQFLSSAYTQISSAMAGINPPKQLIDSILKKYHKKPIKDKIQNQDAINQIFSLPTARQIYNRLQKQNSQFTNQTLATINDQCPFSVALIHKLITVSKNRSLKECFIQDYYLMQKMVVDPNFAEGVRCVLVEKGAKPKWSHNHILEISESQLQLYMSKSQKEQILQI